MKSRMTRKEMLPLVGMTISAFIFNTSEFMPIGLLTDIAGSFSISESKAGMLITVYSWIVMLLSLPLILLVSKIDFRKLFMGTIALEYVRSCRCLHRAMECSWRPESVLPAPMRYSGP